MSGKKKLEDSDEDMKVWDEFQNQLDNLFSILASSNASADSDGSETRFGLNELHMTHLLDACRALDSWFIRKRFILASQCSELVAMEETDTLRLEIARKEKMIADTKTKLKTYIDAITSILDQTTKDLSYCPQP
ncbi:Mediator complex subunit 28 [Fasciolopsis buskii]|uniref:Mediator of RNA polymerase II transcription subunit 28 n=1 Tax=Fasciolopsis buskii TaxID=27845 RepID=A0A8E0S2R6_9TREM|nr:Mediator complex subunit 28 [Fasciolopsis buski]